jgi:signal transduction histidine kinase
MHPEPLPFVDVDRRAQLERSLALARTALALLALVVVLNELTLSREMAPLTSSLIIAYNVYALLAAVLIGVIRPLPLLGALLHIGDILWAVVITTRIESLATTPSMFYLFVVVSAGYRWGLPETLLTGVATAGLHVAGFTMSPHRLLPTVPLAPIGLLTGSFYLMGLAWIIGYLSDEQNRSRAQAAATARVLAAIDFAGGLRASLRRVLSILLTTFDATEVVMLFEESATGRVYRWSLTDADAPVYLDELPAADRDRWLFPVSASVRAWRLRRRATRISGVSDIIARRRRARRAVPEAADLPFKQRALVAVLAIGGEWTGRLLILDPGSRPDTRTIDWLATLVNHLGSALYSLYLLRRLRSRVTVVEQTRLARELHDGLIQTLVGVEMQLEALRRRALAGHASNPEEIAHAQDLLHGEVINARELMQRLKPVEVNPAALPGRLADLTERFRRDTGIETQFVSAVDDELDMSPRLAREVMRIAQEALVNVRKHSGATEVVVRFGASASDWTLVIDDNGCGFESAGRHSLDELERTRRGPVLIKERVRGIRGSLVLDSRPGRGTCLEIRVPRT